MNNSDYRYYLIVDNCAQYDVRIVELENDGKPNQNLEVDSAIQSTAFCNNIFGREIVKESLLNCGYYGWSISKAEFERIKSLIALCPSYKQYLKLAEYV